MIKWASNGEKIEEEKMNFYIDVLGVDLPELSAGIDVTGSAGICHLFSSQPNPYSILLS